MAIILTRPTIEELENIKKDGQCFPVIAIEPRPHKANILKKIKDERFIILQKELDKNNGKADFFYYEDIQDIYFHNKNLSSLHKLSDEALGRFIFFRFRARVRRHIEHVCHNPRKISVETIRLDKIISDHNIENIEWIDIARCQGNQFNALLGMGEFINPEIVEKGVSSGAWAYNVYDNDPNHALDTARHLCNKFNITIRTDSHPINWRRGRKLHRGLDSVVLFSKNEIKDTYD